MDAVYLRRKCAVSQFVGHLGGLVDDDGELRARLLMHRCVLGRQIGLEGALLLDVHILLHDLLLH